MGLIRFSSPRRLVFFSGLILGLALLLSPAGAMAASSRRIGTKPALPAGAKAAGALPQSTHLNLTVTLQPRDPAALAAYATDVSTPGSSVYHQYLSVSEFAKRFGPTPSAITAAEASLRAEGLNPGRVAPNGLSFRVSASAARVAAGLHTSFERYHLPSGRTAYANTSAPLVTGSGSSVVQAVIGLDNLAVEKPQALVRRGGKATPGSLASPHASASSAVTACSALNGAGYTASQIASAYGFNGLYNAGDIGSGVTVALYELEPYSSSDVSSYQSCYGTSVPVTDVSVDGGASCGSGANADPYCGLEDVLDIEDVIGLAPGASVRVYEGPNSDQGAYDTYAQIVNDNVAKVISTSWGMCEADVATATVGTPAAENTLFEQAATQGQTVFAAAGDNGTQDCTDMNGNPTGGQAVDDPASQPYVTGVGGTSLTSISPLSETVWNDGYQTDPNIPGGAGGGGVSTLWTMPSYQSGFAKTQSSIKCGTSTSCREVPDVSANADETTGYAVFWGGSWGPIGGTSAAAPTWASLLALAEASSSCAGAPLGFLNPLLYSAAGSSTYSTDFNDVTSGSNAYDGVKGYSAGTGYDMASGLGSPKGTALTSTICANHDAVTFTSGSPGNQTTDAGHAASPFTVTATSSLEPPITYSAINLPPGISMSSSSTGGTVSGTPTVPGTYAVTLEAIDKWGTTATQSFTWTVSGATVTLAGVPSSLTGRVGTPVLTSALSSTDSLSYPITYTATGLPAGLTINHNTGVISGTPTQAANTTVTIKAADAYGGSASRSFNFLVVGAPRISSSSLHISGTKGSLTFTVRAGQYAASVKKVELITPTGAHLAGGRTLKSSVNAFTVGGKRQTISRTLSRGKLFLTLKSALSGTQVRLTGSELTFSRTLASGLSHRTKSVKLSLLVTDAAGVQTPLTLTLR